jgi:hypothetical protein
MLPRPNAAIPRGRGTLVDRFCRIRSDWLVLVLLFLTTVDYRFRLLEGMPSFTVAEAGSYAAALLYFGVMSTGSTPWTEHLRKFHKENLPVLRYFAWVLIALAVGVARSKDIVPVVKDLFPAFVMYVLMVSIITTQEQLRRVIAAFLFGIGVNSVLGFAQVMTNRFYIGEMHEITLMKTDPYGTIVDHMAMGFLSHPNGFAMILLPAVLMITAVLRFDYFRSRGLNGLLLALLILTGFNMYNTFSKGAMGWTAIGVLLLLSAPGIRPTWRFPVGIGALVLGILSFISISVWLFLTYSEAFGTTLGRIQLWGAGVSAISSGPWVFLFGSGFEEIADFTYTLFAYPLDHAHNGFLNQAINYGVPAMILFLVMVVSNLRKLARSGAGEELRPVTYFLFALHVAFFGEYFFEPAQQGVSLQAMTFAMFGLTTIVTRGPKDEPGPEPPPGEAGDSLAG